MRYPIYVDIFIKRMRGIEPLALAWKAKVLPLYDIRVSLFILSFIILAEP